MRLAPRWMMMIVFLGALSACQSLGSKTPDPTRVTATDDGRTVDLRPGQLLEVVLDSNRTTGYNWALLTDDASQLLVLQDQAAYVRTPAASGMVGVGGSEVWHFRALQTGQTTLKLGYRRPWETNVAPVRTWTLVVRVR